MAFGHLQRRCSGWEVPKSRGSQNIKPPPQVQRDTMGKFFCRDKCLKGCMSEHPVGRSFPVFSFAASSQSDKGQRMSPWQKSQMFSLELSHRHSTHLTPNAPGHKAVILALQDLTRLATSAFPPTSDFWRMRGCASFHWHEKFTLSEPGCETHEQDFSCFYSKPVMLIKLLGWQRELPLLGSLKGTGSQAYK